MRERAGRYSTAARYTATRGALAALRNSLCVRDIFHCVRASPAFSSRRRRLRVYEVQAPPQRERGENEEDILRAENASARERVFSAQVNAKG